MIDQRFALRAFSPQIAPTGAPSTDPRRPPPHCPSQTPPPPPSGASGQQLVGGWGGSWRPNPRRCIPRSQSARNTLNAGNCFRVHSVPGGFGSR